MGAGKRTAKGRTPDAEHGRNNAGTGRWQGSDGAADAARPETDRPFRGAGTARRRRHGAGLSRPLGIRPPGGDQDRARGTGRGPALPGPLHA
ncbi:hypothetical protein SBRY_30267 [Actinacidiphila bryophytorum]|uniref:Uncharacterized protein n=1 Tax=Actinacidiphila bryophytorum TaxID=1436133 RepID=A0A9W4H0R1_9ACTN|nr:hypothetical protein SBRY_30267 [Actinacidiphila bryophytorum]